MATYHSFGRWDINILEEEGGYYAAHRRVRKTSERVWMHVAFAGNFVATSVSAKPFVSDPMVEMVRRQAHHRHQLSFL